MNNSSVLERELSLEALLEALLFVAPNAVSPGQLATALEIPLDQVERGLERLDRILLETRFNRGLRLQKHRGRFQLTTAPQAAPVIERFLGLDSESRLSRAALETLAIIIYKQPVTRPQIDGIRGVNSDGVLKSLLSKGLIQENGRAETPGKPILYGTTPELLQFLGINSFEELPKLNLNRSLENNHDENTI